MNFVGTFGANQPVDGSGAHPNAQLHAESVTTHAPSDAIVVPDAHLLFTGDFKRSGVDLILSKDDHELVLQDYFRGEKRAALASPDGAHLSGDLVNTLAGHVEYAQADGSASVATVIGHVTKLVGTATAIRNGVSIVLNQGDNVDKGDVVQSGSDSTLGITFIDGTVFGLSSNAKMVLNEMVYDPNGSNNSSLLSLVAGTISFVAGETAKHGDMKIDTPVATMGIRGTAVLVEIDFDVPQGGAPDAKFQVLVEPDGSTGSYILFDKNTLAPIATVNQAGTQTIISNGNVSFLATAPLSADVQKLISEVFSEKFTDNTNVNTKSLDHFTDTLLPQTFQPFITSNGTVVIPVFVNVLAASGPPPSSSTGPINPVQHIDQAPTVVTFGDSISERAGVTHSGAIDTASGKISFVDVNAGDFPTAKTSFTSFTYQNAEHTDVTATLSALQLADIAAVEAKLVVVAAPGNNNNGSATWTYSVADGAFDFLAAGETLTLTYTAEVDSNYIPDNLKTFQSFTITITGTNDVPVITTGPESVAYSGGKFTAGGNLQTVGNVPTTGTLSFVDVDLTDTHTVATALTGASMSGPGAPTLDMAELDVLAPTPMAAFEKALSATVAHDSTGTGNGTIDWTLADLPVYLADFIPQGETLTLTYTVTVADEHNATSTQNVIVTITGTAAAAVVWIATTGSGSTGDWNDPSNWETGTVPNAGNDVIIITDQLQGKTPYYPVTINDLAYANSLTMNDFGTLFANSPTLINNSTLTVGAGGVSLSADTIVNNYGTIIVGGLMELLDESSLQNYGQITLQDGGDFKDSGTVTIATVTHSGTVTNSGTIEVAAGALDVEVGIANSGQITVDQNAKLTLNGATIDGGIITNKAGGIIDLTGGGVLKTGSLGNSGQINVSGTGNELYGETVSANHALEVLSGGALLIDQGSAVTNGGLTIDSGATLTVNGAGITGGTVTDNGIIDLTGTAVLKTGSLVNSGQINVSGTGNELYGETVSANHALEVLSGGALLIDQGSAVTNGGLTIDSGATLTVNGAGITGGTVANATNGIIDLTGAAVLKTGSVGNSGQINVSGIGNALDHENITANNVLEVMANSALLLDQGTGVTNGGTITIDGTATLTLNSASIDGGTVTNATNGTLDLTGTAVLKTGSLGNSGTIDVTGTGNALDNENITANKVLEVMGNSALLIDQGSAVTNGGLTIDSGATLTVNGAGITGGTVTDSGTLDLTGTAVLKNGSLGNSGQINVSGIGNALDNENITANNVLEVMANSALLLDQGTGVTNGGTITIDGTATLTLNGAGITGGTINDYSLGSDGITVLAGTIDVSGASTIIDASLNKGGITIEQGSSLTLSNDTVTGASIVVDGSINAPIGELILQNGTTLGSCRLQIDSGDQVTLNGATITGGTVTGSGTIDVTGASEIDGGATLNNGYVTIESGKTLTLDTMTVNGTTVTDKGTIVLDDTVKLTGGATLQGALSLALGLITNNGTLEVTGAAELLDDTLTNSSATGGVIQVDALQTLTLSGAEIIDGTLNNGGTLGSTGSSALTAVGITNSGTIESTGGILTIDAATAVVPLTNSGTLEANGGELDITSDSVTNTGILQAIDDSTLKLTTLTVTNTTGGTVTVGSGSTLDLVGANIDGGTLDNSGTIDNVSGSNSISAAITNTGTIEVGSGTLDLTGGLSGTGSLVIDAGATLELAGANAQTVTFSGASDTLQLDNALGFTGTIAGVSSTGGTFTITGQGGVTSTSGDAIDFTASGGVVGNTADVTLTPAGTVTGAANGIVVIQNGAGDLAVDPSGNVVGLAGDGVIAEDSTTGTGNIVVDGTGSVSGSGTGSAGLLAENLNAANAGNITVTQLDGASGGSYGIEAGSNGSGTVGVEAGAAITGTAASGIRALSFGSGDISVKLDSGSTLTSGSAGIIAVNEAAAVPSSADSSITVTAYGTIDSGSALVSTGNPPAGILAGYLGGSVIPSSPPLTSVNGDVTVNSYAAITAAAGDGIRAYNYGIGDVTVNDDAGTITALGGTSPTNGFGNGIAAYNFGTGDTSVTTAAGVVIHSGASGIDANNGAAAAPSTSEVYVLAYGTITSGTIPTSDGNPAAGILAGYNYNSAADNNAHGNVVIDDYASITAAAGTDGIRGYNYGTGTVTITAEAGADITAGRYGIAAVGKDGGDVSITNDATVSAETAIYAMTGATGTATIDNHGTITGAVTSYNATFTNESGAVWNLTGSSVFTGASTIENIGTIDTTSAGSVTLGNGSHVTLTNASSGVIDATEGTLTLDTDNTIANAGLLEATATGTLRIDDSVNNSGTLEADGGTLVIGGHAAISGAAMVTVTGGGLADFVGTSTQTLVLNATFSGSGALELDHSQHYGGTISGFGAGDTIDLTDLTYSSNETDVWNSSTDTLTITSGTHSSSLTFSGSSYGQNSFALTSDANHDTEVVLSAAQAALSHLDSAGNAVQDTAVTVTLTDPHATNVSYQWLDNGVAITGATGSSYTPTTADFGKALDVVVGYTDGTTDHITALAGTVAAAPEVSFDAGDTTTDENAPLTLNTLNVAFTDAGSDTVTVSLDAGHGTLSLGSAAGVSDTGNGSTTVSLSGTLAAIDLALAGGVTYTPNSGFVGADTVSFAASDGAFNSNTATLNVNVLGPVATSFTIANAAGPTSGGWSYDPENGHYYKYVAATSDDWTTAMAAAAADNGAYLATITSAAESVFVSQAIASGATAWTGGQSTQDPASGRPQNGSVPFYWFDGPEAGALFTYTSWNNDNLPPGGGEPTGGFNTSVEALQVGSNGEWNDVPTTWANGQGGYIEEYGGLAGQVAFTENTSTDLAASVLLAEDTDTSRGTLTVTGVGAAAHGTVTLNGDIISYDPILDYSGADSFTYTISDGTFTSTSTVSFNVAAVPTVLWNTSSGDWITSAATWSTSAVPTNADDVTINTASDTPYTVTIASGEAASAQTLTLDSAAATLLDAGSLTLTGGLVVEAGTFELQGGSLHALSISVASAGMFSGYGTIASPIAVTGTVQASGGNLDFASYVTGHGTFSIDAGATLEFDGPVSTGSVVSFAASAGTLIIEQSTSFQGEVSGALASGDVIDLGGLLSNGNIIATQTGDTFQTAVSYDSVHGTTLLTVIDETHGQSTFLALAGDYTTSSWTVTSDGHGGVDIADPPAAASLTVASGASLEIPNAVVTAETVTFHGSTGSLTLDAPSSFHGTIAGFTGDGTLAGSDQIDLKGIDYHSSSFAESFNASTDTLSVSDGTDDASLHFTGSYVAANFSFTTDGNGGTIVYDPPVSSNPASPPAKTAVADVASETSHGFVFNFANAGHDTAPDFHPTAGEQHPMPANALTALGIIHDDARGNTVMVPAGHDTLTMAGILKAQLHADFHFV